MEVTILKYSERIIIYLQVFLGLVTIALPSVFLGVAYGMGISFDDSVNSIIVILNVLVAFVTFYEGKSVIKTLKNHRIEASPEHIVHIRDTKRELIFFHEIEKVKVIEGVSGKVKRIKISTKDRQTVLEHYESLEDLIALIRTRTCSEMQFVKPKLGMFFSMLVPLIAVASQWVF
ncbi:MULTISPECIES: hypothetical protein [unclassified Fusibacter]|uniref:hypothetical protein n=1 Tax=unclassified Fusibacter TaxID=2624464 RepID=UPI0010131951|nr:MULTISPECIES: hypothetical protein [unclassified Fusibacter]MCK8059405.1 hypothetical protein [Fusibacter sp. A2]NPE21131.1 hypothetical protein [Fusibacter sp. A1]RXV62400.1 hypothetical protein DWB64_04795 [Fusibacter sp. A1]